MTKRHALLLGIMVTVCVGLTVAWRWTPLADWFSLEAITAWVAGFRRDPNAPFWIIAAFVIAAQVFFPITLLSLATVFAFGPLVGVVYSVVGSLVGGIVTYVIGRMLGEATIYRIAGPRLEKAREQIKVHGLAASIMVHILPVAPFTLVNLLSGASGVRFRDFVLGMFIGHLPGTISILIFQRQFEQAIKSPDATNIALLAVVIGALTLGSLWLHRRVGNKGSAGATVRFAKAQVAKQE